ncbi:MAG: SpoIVB peptidase S55 domain-containing protein [Patescibacteria group bacterium]
MYKRLFAPLIAALLIAAGPPAMAKLSYVPLAQIRAGQKATGYTVVSGTRIRPFAVEILGVLQNQARDRSFILVRVSGSLLRESKGIAAGMSGSPVYISGRLAGAVSYAFDRADPSYGLVTPIEDMLRLWEGEGAAEVALAPSRLLPAGAARAVPVATPLLVSGRRAPPLLAEAAARAGMSLVAAGEAMGAHGGSTPPLRPGGAVAAVFALGDYSAAAIGTVTWVDGGRFLAFGHPVANLGRVDYPATGAYIHAVVPSADLPFKIGSPLEPVGRFAQDRGAGAAGLAGERAETVLVKASIEDAGTGRRRAYETRVVREPALLKAVAVAALLDACDQTFDRYTGGTAEVGLTLTADGLKEPLTRRNVYYDAKDVANAALAEVGEAVDLVLGNAFLDLRLRTIELEVRMRPVTLLASIAGIRADREQVKPGDEVKLDVSLRPFRAEPVTAAFTFTVPKTARPGKLVVTVRGGFVERREENGKELGLGQISLPGDEPGSLAEALTRFTNRPRNNDLLLEFLALPAERGNGDEAGAETIKLVKSCDYVVKGQSQLILTIQPTNGSGAG